MSQPENECDYSIVKKRLHFLKWQFDAAKFGGKSDIKCSLQDIYILLHYAELGLECVSAEDDRK